MTEQDTFVYADRESVYASGDPRDGLYLVMSGRVRLVRDEGPYEATLGVVEAGEFFGEMALFSRAGRTTSAVAEGETVLRFVDRDEFLRRAADPVVQRVFLRISDRLRRVDRLLDHLQTEQYRIRQDAHDRVYNRLAALSKLVEVAGLQNGEVCAETLDEDGISLGQIADDIRATVTQLQQILGDRPHHDASSDFRGDAVLERLHGICREQSQRWRMDVDLRPPDELPSVPQHVCWDLECILEETLTNAAKHGRARRVDVRVDVTGFGGDVPPQLTLLVTDDGLGMDLAPALEDLPSHSHGLRGIRTRAERHGGSMRIDSAPGGTAVTILVPVERRQVPR